MTGHNRIFTRSRLLLALALIAIVSHALILRFALQHKGLLAATMVGVVILVVMAHLGLLNRLHALLRWRSK